MYTVSFFNPELESKAWDQFVENCPMATWMHSQKFITYHGNKFVDKSIIVKNDKDQWVGLLPVAVDPKDPSRVVSHSGLSYGGMLHSGKLQGEAMVSAFEELASFYKTKGFRTLRYKAMPYFYHQYPCQDDIYALFRINAERYRCDLASIIDLENRPKANQKRKWELQQALKSGITVSEHNDPRTLWAILEDNLKRKHGAMPAHSLDEIILLKERFPEEIRFISAYHEGEMIAGFVLFVSKMVAHLQYSASSEKGYELFALHPVAEHCIALAEELKCRYFDFGTSNENEGRYLNEGLHRFKAKFGSGGAIHEYYDIDLTQF